MRLTLYEQVGKLMADGASNNDTMAQLLSELVEHFETTDRGCCLNHVLHLSAMRILNPFDAKPGQLEWALVDVMRRLDISRRCGRR